MTFYAAEEVFDPMTAPVKASGEGARPTAFSSTWDASSAANGVDPLAKLVGIEAFIGDQSASPKKDEVRFDCADIITCSYMKTQRDSPTQAIGEYGELGVETALGFPNCLGLSASRRIGTVLVHLDVGRIRKARLSAGGA